jgi:transcriptional regulator with XRE-family HTH domain
MISPAQCRAARALLDWSQRLLAETARVGVVTVRQFESGLTTPRNATLDVIVRAFEAAGVEFTFGEAPGVKLHAAALAKKKKR